jgi:hypothetical protein
MEDIEIDLDDLVIRLFNDEPKEAKSIYINFERDNIKELFEDLISIFNTGCKILFGDSNGKVILENLDEDEFQYLNRYFNSIGFDIYYTIYDEYNVSLLKGYLCGYIKTYLDVFDTIKIGDIINYKNSNSNRLEDLRFQLRVKNKIYIIGFKSII